MKLGVFGGSFDPVHMGHLLLAETCRESCGLDHVLFVPAFVPPHKQDKSLADPKHRVEMLRLALAGHESFAVCEDEINRGGTSFTYQTLEGLHESYPNDDLFFLMGADSLDEFSTWKKPDRICELATPVIVRRRGSSPVDFEKLSSFFSPDKLKELESYEVDFPAIEISSTEIRKRLNEGRSVRYRLPRAVEKYIESSRLYQ